jgi:hypothetical protein
MQRPDGTRGVLAPVVPQPEPPLPHGLGPPPQLVLTQPRDHVPVNVGDVAREAADDGFLGRNRERIKHLAVQVERQPTAGGGDRLAFLVADPLGVWLSAVICTSLTSQQVAAPDADKRRR